MPYPTAFAPYHGNYPLNIYIIMYPKLSKSSLLLASTPWCWFMLANLAVPDRGLSSLKGICCYVLGSLYILASPKSIKYIVFLILLRPIKKFEGLISRWIKFYLWSISIRSRHCKATIKVVFSENELLHKPKRCYKLGPNFSLIKILFYP